MGKHTKKAEKRINRRLLLIVCGVALIAVLGVVLLIWGISGLQKPDEQPDGQTGAPQSLPDELVIQTVEEQGDVVVVSTSYCTLKYPFAFSDLIHVDAVTGESGAALEFTTVLEGVEADLFTLHFGGEGNHLLGTLTLGEEKKAVDVWVTFHEVSDALSSNYYSTFYAAQETFNDVVVSLAENENFTPAE